MRNEFFVLENAFPLLVFWVASCLVSFYSFSFVLLHFQVFFPPLITFFKESFFTSGLLDREKKKNNNDNHVLFFSIIPHSYTVSVWKAAGMRHRTGRKWELGVLLGRRQERFDPRVSGQESFLSVSEVTRLPFDSGSLLVIKDNAEGLPSPMPDTQQAQTVG